MITVTAEVQAVLDSGAAWYADLYTFTLRNGTVLRYTSLDQDVEWAGNTWVSCQSDAGPLIERGSITYTVGLSVDSLDLTIYTHPSMKVAGVTWPTAMRLGLFDAANVSLVRSVGRLGELKPVGIIPRFTGRVGPCEPGRSKSRMQVESLLAYLRAPVPRNVYQPSCSNTVYDGACLLDRASREQAVTVVSVSADGLQVQVTGATLVVNKYLAGFARYTASGANVNQQVTVASNDADTLTLLYPFPATLLPGQTLALAPGCNKTLAACRDFDNEPHFRGHPHVPVPETML